LILRRAGTFFTGVIMKIILAVAMGTVLLFAGCKATEPQKSGFIGDYSKLQQVSENSLVYVNNQKLGQYSKFIVDKVQTRFPDANDEEKMNTAAVANLENRMRGAITSDLEHNGYQVVEQPGPGVARIRLALTDIKKGKPVFNVIPYSAIIGVGLGGATAEAEILDSQTHEQIAAAVESQLGKRFTLSGLSRYGNAETTIDDWAQRIVMRINYSHGRAEFR
jgi:hypothetical protein